MSDLGAFLRLGQRAFFASGFPPPINSIFRASVAPSPDVFTTPRGQARLDAPCTGDWTSREGRHMAQPEDGPCQTPGRDGVCSSPP